MKILHTESSCGWGGQEIRVLDEAAGMIARGHTVELACPREARIHDEALARGIPVHALPMVKKRPGGVIALRRLFALGHFDIINTHSSTDTWLSALAAKSLGRKAPALVRTRHISAAIPNNAASRWLYRKASAHVVTTGEALRERLIADRLLPAQQVTSVPTGIDLSRYTPGDRASARRQLGIPEDALVIGIVATLRSWKGHRFLVEAFSRLADANARLVVVGDGPGRDNLKNQLAELGLSERAFTPGNQADVVPWLHALDIFSLPSYANEGVPQALMQAMACGLPVVSTPVGSIPEIVTHDSTGLLVEPRNIDALTGALQQLADNATARTEMGSRAAAFARERFPREHMLNRMESIFRGACGK